MYCYTVAAAQVRVTAHPGQDVELSCSLGQISGNTRSITIGWLVDSLGPYGVNSLCNGLLTGYSTHAGSISIIIENIMMNDRRNGTEYQCVTMSSNWMIQDYSDTIFLLYVAGEYQLIILDYS